MLKEVFTKLIGDALVQAGRAVKVYMLDVFAKQNYEITPEQYVVLSMLSEESMLYQNKLCEELHKDKSNMTRILSVLEEKGLIEKIQSTENKKQVNKIKITSKGKEVRNKITPQIQFAREKYLDGISQDDMYTCIKVLTKIQENLTKKD